MARASEAAVDLGVSMFNLHALGGRKMMEEAVGAVRKLTSEKGLPMPIMLAVTVLTSLKDADVKGLGFPCTAEELALKLAIDARGAGMSGVVASPREAGLIRQACGKDFVILTPGVRGAGAAKDDQARTLSPYEAVLQGSDYLVVGRPIKTAADPAGAADQICQEIEAALAARARR